MRLLVCGGAGFIGSTFVRQRVREHGDEVTVLDKLTYAGREENFHDLVDDPAFRFIRGAIEDADAVAGAIEVATPEAIVNFAAAIGHVLAHGQPGEVYNAGGPDEEANIDVVKRIIAATGASESQIDYVRDRPGHDRRYSLSSEKVRALGWTPRVRFAEGLEQTVAWYRDNSWWWEPIRSGDYRAYYERQYGRSLA